MADTSLQERRRYNELIETTDASCAMDARDIHTYNGTRRNASVLELYERLYSDFDLLYILTSNLEKIKADPATLAAGEWLSETRDVQKANEINLLQMCRSGAEIAISYHNLLMDQGYISLPGR